MHGHIWGSLLAAPLLNNNHLPFHSALIVSNSLWQIVADKPPAPPPSVTPTQSPHLYRLSFLIFDFTFKVMCFSPMMKSVLKPRCKMERHSAFFALFHIQPPPPARALSSWLFLNSFSVTMERKGGWNATHDHIESSLLFLFIPVKKINKRSPRGRTRPSTLARPDVRIPRRRLTTIRSKHFIQQLFTTGPRRTGLWVSTGPLLIDPPLQPSMRNMYIQYRPSTRSL